VSSSALGTYLDTKNVLRGSRVSEVEAYRETSNQRAQALELLAQAQFPTTMPALLAETGWDVSAFAQAVDVLRKAGLIDVIKEDETETVRLTAQGEALRAN
jgi:DNA-binding MarR family transcriptional regulator